MNHMYKYLPRKAAKWRQDWSQYIVFLFSIHLNDFESLLSSPKLDLFDIKYIKNGKVVKYHYNFK